MALRPRLHLLERSRGSPVALRPIAVGGLQEFLVLTLEVVVQHHAMHARALGLQTVRTPQVRTVELRVVGQLASFRRSRVEALRGRMVVGPMVLQELTPALREGDKRRAAVAFDGRHAANEARATQSLEITVPKISRSSVVIPQIARRHHAKRPDRGQRARFGAAEVVLVLVHVDAFAIMPTR